MSSPQVCLPKPRLISSPDSMWIQTYQLLFSFLWLPSDLAQLHLQAVNTLRSLLSVSGAQEQGMKGEGGLLRFARSWWTKLMSAVCCSGRSESLSPISWGSFNSSSETSVKPNQVRLPTPYTPSALLRHWGEYHFSPQTVKALSPQL